MVSHSFSASPRARAHRREEPRSADAIRQLIQGLDPHLDPESSTAKAATLLIAGLQMEHNVVKLAHVTGIQVEFVARCARRLVDNGVWREGETLCAWSAGEHAQPAFWSDVAVAEGKLCRRSDEEGRLEWAPQGHWWKSFDHVTRAPEEGGTRYHTPSAEPEPDPAAPDDAVARHPHPGGAGSETSDLFPDAVWL